MCKFEQIGVERQYTSVTKEDANRNFRISCTICCNRGITLSVIVVPSTRLMT